MAITEERLQVAAQTTGRGRQRVLPVRARVRRDPSIAGPWAFALLAAWPVMLAVGVALEPAPADPSAPVPWYADVVAFGFFGSLAAAFAGLARRLRWGVVASAAAGLVLTGMSLACPATGHHALEAWWYGQLACCGALLGLTGVAWRRA